MIRQLDESGLITRSFCDKKIILHFEKYENSYGILLPIESDGFRFDYYYMSNDGAITKTHINKSALINLITVVKKDRLWSVDECEDLLFHEANLIDIYSYLKLYLEQHVR